MCAEEAECFLIEGFELSPSYVARLQAALAQAEVRGCFLGHGLFSVEDLVGYRGPKPQHRGASRAELGEAAAWIRRRSRQLREECAAVGVPYVDVGELGFEAAMLQARRLLLGTVESLGGYVQKLQAGRLASSPLARAWPADDEKRPVSNGQQR